MYASINKELSYSEFYEEAEDFLAKNGRPLDD